MTFFPPSYVRTWCEYGPLLFQPEEVLPFLRRETRRFTASSWAALKSLGMWVSRRVAYLHDIHRWGVPDRFQTPGLTLELGTGDCEDAAAVAWSTLPLVGLPEGRLVVGTLHKAGHAWVEVPELGALIEATNGQIIPVRSAGQHGYSRAFYVDEDGCRLD